MKNQALFSSKDKSKELKLSSAAIFIWRFKGKKLMLYCRCGVAGETSPRCIIPSELRDDKTGQVGARKCKIGPVVKR